MHISERPSDVEKRHHTSINGQGERGHHIFMKNTMFSSRDMNGAGKKRAHRINLQILTESALKPLIVIMLSNFHYILIPS